MIQIFEHSIIFPNWSIDWAVLGVLICTVHLTAWYYHVIHALLGESVFFSCLNISKFLASNRRYLSNTYLVNEHLKIYSDQPNKWAMLWLLNCKFYLTAYYYHVMYVLQKDFAVALISRNSIRFSKQTWYLKFKWQEQTWTFDHLVNERSTTTPILPNNWARL